MTVNGTSLAHPLPVTLWLTRGALPVPPWDGTTAPAVPPPAGLGRALRCPVVPGSVSEVGLSCVVPPGAGVGWRVLLVNHDVGEPGVPGSLSSVFWQYSALSDLVLHYHGPEVLALEVGGPIVCGLADALLLMHCFSRIAPVSLVSGCPAPVIETS